jgi:hypothetical protein
MDNLLAMNFGSKWSKETQSSGTHFYIAGYKKDCQPTNYRQDHLKYLHGLIDTQAVTLHVYFIPIHMYALAALPMNKNVNTPTKTAASS